MSDKYWTVHMRVEKGNKPLNYSQTKGFALSLTANMRLAENDHLHLDSYELGAKLITAITPVLDKRYGQGRWEYSIDEQVKRRHNDKQIEKDSSIVRARIKTKNFAPNKPVEI